MVQTRLGDVVIDPTYQMRMKLNSNAVSKYAEFMRMGDIFPPIVLEKKTNKVVCGFTRMEAYTKVFEPSKKIPCEVKTFKNELERQLFAVEDNAKHGEPFGTFDKKNIILRLIDSGMTKNNLSDISILLGMRISRIQDIYGMKIITLKGGKKTAKIAKEISENPTAAKLDPHAAVDGEAKPLKRGLTHKHGTEMKAEVYEEVVEHYNGWPDSVVIDQLLLRIDNDLLDMSKSVTKKLIELYNKLGNII